MSTRLTGRANTSPANTGKFELLRPSENLREGAKASETEEFISETQGRDTIFSDDNGRRTGRESQIIDVEFESEGGQEPIAMRGRLQNNLKQLGLANSQADDQSLQTGTSLPNWNRTLPARCLAFSQI